MKILLLGRDGQVGWELQRSLAPLGELVTAGRQQADLSRPDALRALVRDVQPSVIVNAAAYTAVDKAESELELARCVNAESVGILAEEAHRLGAWLVHYSTDYVFDGTKDSAYTEDDATNPLSAYGRTKLEGEQLVRSANARHLIFRTSWVYAARGSNFAKTMLRLAKEREELKVVADQYGAPTSAELIADVTAFALYRIHACGDGSGALSGTYHLVASGETTWHQYAQYVLELAAAEGHTLRTLPNEVKAIPASAYPVPAPRPKNSRLDSTRLTRSFNIRLPDWRYHLRRWIVEMQDNDR